MRIDDKNDTVVMLKIRANLYSLANYYIEEDYHTTNKQTRFNARGPKKFKVFKLSRDSSDATKYWHMAEADVWSDEDTSKIKRFYSLKRKSGELERAIKWERPRFNEAPKTCNWWRAKLHGLA